MSNHLGNVLTVINDIKVPQSSNSVDIDGYLATIVSTADYSPFGVQLDGRTESAESYRYGYQGSEKDDEVKGSGNSYITEFRLLDPRLGRWLSIDPLAAEFPWQSPYVSMDNDPIGLNDPLGLSAQGEPKKTEHKVESGQTLSGIAKMYNTTVDAIMENNSQINWERDRKSGGLIFKGETLIIPDNRQQNNQNPQNASKPNIGLEAPKPTQTAEQAKQNNVKPPVDENLVSIFPSTDAPKWTGSFSDWVNYLENWPNGRKFSNGKFHCYVDDNGREIGVAPIGGTAPIIGGPLRSGQSSLKIGQYFFNPTHFHRVVKPSVLAKAGQYAGVVGKNPDIVFEGGKIILKGAKNGPYAGKSFDTGLSILDFIF